MACSYCDPGSAHNTMSCARCRTVGISYAVQFPLANQEIMPAPNVPIYTLPAPYFWLGRDAEPC